ncbi:hypothetical protein TGVAND_222192 [Toxoplasma gondii VAND]|uniref:Protein HGH1 C-terminal domain-containing protein n=1 Tax=Toxoplasma gondii VAND TaxID=933077 RepID=A0A086PT91_TOXGO|nr:hypothetical protein TGVAND_222192 [Toxoplasma gondii VAND]
MERSMLCTPEEASLYGDVLELLQHPHRRDVRTQALHACVQCSSQASFLSFLRSLLPEGSTHAEKREVSESHGTVGEVEREPLSPRKDLDRFLRSCVRNLGQEEDGASAAAVEVLINLSADEVLADHMVKRELHMVNVVVDNLEEQTKNEAPRHANISLMLLSNLTRKEEAGLALLATKHGLPGFNLVRLIRVLDAAARSPLRRLPKDTFWQEEGYFILSTLQNISSLREGTATLAGALLPQLNSLLSLLPLLPPNCHSPLLRLCLNLCLDKNVHASICRFPPPSFSSSRLEKKVEQAQGEATGNPHLALNGDSCAPASPASLTSTRDSTANSPSASAASSSSSSAASDAESDSNSSRSPSVCRTHAVPQSPDADGGRGAKREEPSDIPCSLLLALASFLYPPPGPKRAFMGEDKVEKNAQRRDEGQKAPDERKSGSSSREEGEEKEKREETESGDAQREKGEKNTENPTAENVAHTDAEVARLRFLHPIVSLTAYGPAGSALSRSVVVNCFSALALTETGRNSMRESGIYEVLRCVHLLEEQTSPVRQEIENMVHILVYSEEELRQQDEDLARSAQRESPDAIKKRALAGMAV